MSFENGAKDPKRKKRSSGDPSKRSKSSDKATAAAIKKGVEQTLAEHAKLAEKEEEGKAYLTQIISDVMSNVAGVQQKKTGVSMGSTSASAPSKAEVLKSILKKAKGL
jgi:hypothetical protein